METLNAESQRLLFASAASSTWSSYRTGLRAFDKFRESQNFVHNWPVPLSHLIAFIAFMSIKDLAVSTARLYIASISALHKLRNLSDSTAHFLICKLLEGFRRCNAQQVRTRGPITYRLLVKVVNVLPSICHSHYEFFLFKAAFALAFFGFLHISEFALTGKNATQPRMLKLADVKIIDSSPPVALVHVGFSKTDQRGRGTDLRLIGNSPSQVCPVMALKEFLELRSQHPGPLFCHFDKSPVTRYQVQAILRSALSAVGEPCSNFSTHSFRIGSATSAATNSVSEERMKEMGRWNSEAYKSYICIPSRDISCLDSV